MSVLTMTIAFSLMLMGVLHIVLGWKFARFLAWSKRKLSQFENLPNVSILLPLRGADPFLEQSLASLSNQDYPNFRVRIVVDHASDDAHQLCKRLIENGNWQNFEVEVLKTRFPTCGLKCSSLIQAMESLEDRDEIVVLVDSDVVTHSTWLRELVNPLSDPKVGITTGNQWFAPSRFSPGACVRAVWNAGAMVPTAMLGHPWAGSCAMRLADVKRSGLIEAWKGSIVDDGPIGNCLSRLQLETRFVPSTIMFNREQCSLSFCVSYIRRMLTWSRLYEKTYFLTVIHALVLIGLTLACVVGLIHSAFTEAYLLAAASGLGLMTFWMGNVIGYRLIETAVKNHANAESVQSTASIVRVIALFVAVPITHIIYAISAFRACFVRRVKWRGITYRIEPQGRVHMLGYSPYPSAKSAQRSETSL